MSPLLVAAEGGHCFLVRYLLAKGCSKSHKNLMGYTSLMLAKIAQVHRTCECIFVTRPHTHVQLIAPTHRLRPHKLSWRVSTAPHVDESRPRRLSICWRIAPSSLAPKMVTCDEFGTLQCKVAPTYTATTTTTREC